MFPFVVLGALAAAYGPRHTMMSVDVPDEPAYIKDVLLMCYRLVVPAWEWSVGITSLEDDVRWLHCST